MLKLHNLVSLATLDEAECCCGWRGQPPAFAEHLAEVAKRARGRLRQFVDFVDEKAGSSWNEICGFAADTDFLTPAAFVRAMHNVGF